MSAHPSNPPSIRGSALKSTRKMPRCELDLLRREASGETFEDGAPPSSVVLPLVTKKSASESSAPAPTDD